MPQEEPETPPKKPVIGREILRTEFGKKRQSLAVKLKMLSEKQPVLPHQLVPLQLITFAKVFAISLTLQEPVTQQVV